MKPSAFGVLLPSTLLLLIGCGRRAPAMDQDEKIANAKYERLYNESVVLSNGFDNVALLQLKALHQEYERRSKDHDPAAGKWFREQLEQLSETPGMP